MNKKLILALLLVLTLTLTGCSTRSGESEGPSEEESPAEQGGTNDDTTTSEASEIDPLSITTPEQYLAAFDDADIVVGDNGFFYAEAHRVDWVSELDLTDTTEVATVGRSGVTEGFEAWDANVLPEGTTISIHNAEKTVLVADVDGEPVPYLQYVFAE